MEVVPPIHVCVSLLLARDVDLCFLAHILFLCILYMLDFNRKLTDLMVLIIL